MITPDGWFSWAIRDPGPATAVNGGRNGGKGMIPHSAEGHWDSLQALHDFHWSRATNPDPRKRASWGATNLADGRFVQHYPVTAQTWTSGAGYPNNNFFAFENEGVAGEPLTQAQIDNIIRVGRELIALQGWVPRRPANGIDFDASLYEHNETTRWGGAYTACPSGRIPWDIIVPALQEEDDVKPLVAWDTTRKRVYIIGGWGAAHVVFPADAAELAKLYGAPTVALSAETIDAFNTP